MCPNDVSIVLPTYNGSAYLVESLESILRQTFSNWELIAVDDCSTDETGDILEAYAKKDSRIQVIHNQTNQKLPASLNIGFREASGKYLTWTSDDNIYRETALQRMKELLDANPSVFLTYAQIHFINADGTPNHEVSYRYEPSRLILHDVIGACFMYRREVLDEIGEYDTGLFCVEDHDYWIRIAERHPIHHIPEILYDYRWHDGSLTATKKETIRRQRGRLREKHIDFTISSLKNRPFDLCQVFFAYVHDTDTIDASVYKKFTDTLPVLINLKFTLPDKPIILFGAGIVGSRAAKMLDGKVVAFADNDSAIVGTSKNGLPILSFKEMLEQDVDVVISVGMDKVYEIICQLIENNVQAYRVWQILADQL